MNGREIEQVAQLKYLESIITDIKTRIGIAKSTFKEIKQVLNRCDVSI